MRLKVVKTEKSDAKPKTDAKLNLRARRVPADCPPGKYLVGYVIGSGKRVRKFNRPELQMLFDIAEGIYAGQRLFSWVPLREDEAVNPGSRYYEMAALALGHAPDTEADLDPDVILAGKIFVAVLGYGKRKGKADFSDDYAKEKKGDGDFIRVHALIEVMP